MIKEDTCVCAALRWAHVRASVRSQVEGLSSRCNQLPCLEVTVRLDSGFTADHSSYTLDCF